MGLKPSPSEFVLRSVGFIFWPERVTLDRLETGQKSWPCYDELCMHETLEEAIH